jgi:hypothetical protein
MAYHGLRFMWPSPDLRFGPPCGALARLLSPSDFVPPAIRALRKLKLVSIQGVQVHSDRHALEEIFLDQDATNR